MKKTFKFTGLIQQITGVETILRDNKFPIIKKLFELETVDGQILFIEARNKSMKLLDNITEPVIVEVEVVFEGSYKNDKMYNNINLVSLTKN
jgi:hypothetical protein